MAIRIFPCSLLRKDITITSKEYGAVTKNEQEERKLQETIQGIQQLQRFKKKLIARDIASMSHRLQVILNKASAKKSYSNVLFTPEELHEIQRDERRERARKQQAQSAPCRRIKHQRIVRKLSSQTLSEISSTLLPRGPRKYSSGSCVKFNCNNGDELEEKRNSNVVESKLTIRRVSRYNKDGVQLDTKRINTWIEDANESFTESSVPVDSNLRNENNDKLNILECKQTKFLQNDLTNKPLECNVPGKLQGLYGDGANLASPDHQPNISKKNGDQLVVSRADAKRTRPLTIQVSPVDDGSVDSGSGDDNGGQHFEIPQILFDEIDTAEENDSFEKVVRDGHFVVCCHSNNDLTSNNSDSTRKEQSMFATHVESSRVKTTKIEKTNIIKVTSRKCQNKEMKPRCPDTVENNNLPASSSARNNDRRLSTKTTSCKLKERESDTIDSSQQSDEKATKTYSLKSSKKAKNIIRNRSLNVNKRQEEVSRRLMIGIPTVPLKGNTRFVARNDENDTVEESNTDDWFFPLKQPVRKENKKMLKRLTLMNNLLGPNLRVDGGGSTVNEGLTNTTQVTDLGSTLAPPSLMNKILLQRRKTVTADEIVIPGGWEIQRCSESIRGNNDLDAESVESTEPEQDVDVYEELKKCRYLRLPAYLNVD